MIPDESPPLNSPNELLYIDRESSNILDMLDILDTPRTSTCFHLKKSVAKAFRTYGRRHPSYNIADCLEFALLEYIQNHPLKDVALNFNLVEKIKDRVLHNRIEEKILSSEITRVLNLIDCRNDKGRNNNSQYVFELQDLLLKAIKLKIPSRDMDALLERAEAYI